MTLLMEPLERESFVTGDLRQDGNIDAAIADLADEVSGSPMVMRSSTPSDLRRKLSITSGIRKARSVTVLSTMPIWRVSVSLARSSPSSLSNVDIAANIALERS